METNNDWENGKAENSQDYIDKMPSDGMSRKIVFRGIGAVLAIGLFVVAVAFVWLVTAVFDACAHRDEAKIEALRKQRDRFKEDMMDYFGIQESEYTIVEEWHDQSSIYTYLVFKCGGEEKYYYADGCTDYKAEEFRKKAGEYLESVIEQTGYFAGMETEVSDVGIGCRGFIKEENMIPLGFHKATEESFLSEKDPVTGKSWYGRPDKFYLTFNVQVTAEEPPTNIWALRNLNETVPFLQELTVECYRIDPVTQEKTFERQLKLEYKDKW